jgi:hypothetical protein
VMNTQAEIMQAVQDFQAGSSRPPRGSRHQKQNPPFGGFVLFNRPKAGLRPLAERRLGAVVARSAIAIGTRAALVRGAVAVWTHRLRSSAGHTGCRPWHVARGARLAGHAERHPADAVREDPADGRPGTRTAIAVRARSGWSLATRRSHLGSGLHAIGHIPTAEFRAMRVVTRLATGAMRLALETGSAGRTRPAVAARAGPALACGGRA